MMYTFALLDPRPIEAAQEANKVIFTQGDVLGIEVTVPTLAERCVLGNIDPQHGGGDANRAAIEDALLAELPPEGSVLATVRADLDSVGSMAVLAMRAAGEDFSAANERIALVAESDKFSRGPWPGPRPLPSRDNPWPKDQASAESSRPLAAIAACVADFRNPLDERVEAMGRWLITGEEPEGYRERVEADRAAMVAALEDGSIVAALSPAGSKVAVVLSTHRAATTVGYMLAPVVIAVNPEFRFRGGDPHRKFTICQYRAGHVDLQEVLTGLQEIEEGWGGSPTIIGSPQGTSSNLDVEVVLGVVRRHHLST